MAEETSDQTLGTEERPLVVKPEKPYEKLVDLVRWEAHGRVFKTRSPVWFLSLFVLGLTTLLVLALLQQWTLILVVLSVVFVLAAFNLVEPGMREYTVTTLGVKIGGRLFDYTDMKWFWFDEEGEIKTLYIATYLGFPHLLEITLPDGKNNQLHQQIEDHLLKYLPYHEEKRRDVLRWLDRAVVQISPWLPQSLVDWYTKRAKLIG